MNDGEAERGQHYIQRQGRCRSATPYVKEGQMTLYLKIEMQRKDTNHEDNMQGRGGHYTLRR